MKAFPTFTLPKWARTAPAASLWLVLAGRALFSLGPAVDAASRMMLLLLEREEAFTSGARGLTEADLERAYKSVVDPRLNDEQALERVFSVVHTRRALRE